MEQNVLLVILIAIILFSLLYQRKGNLNDLLTQAYIDARGDKERMNQLLADRLDAALIASIENRFVDGDLRYSLSQSLLDLYRSARRQDPNDNTSGMTEKQLLTYLRGQYGSRITDPAKIRSMVDFMIENGATDSTMQAYARTRAALRSGKLPSES